jgi:hypothetical protein
MPKQPHKKNKEIEMKTTNENHLQQGDVLIERLIEQTDTSKGRVIVHPSGRVVLAEGEATGHAHVVKCEPGTEAKLIDMGDQKILEITGGKASVVHEEHKTITKVGPGQHEISIVKEYDYDAEEAKQVID